MRPYVVYFPVYNLWITGLLQLCAYSFTGINARTAPESPPRCCSVGSWLGTTWTRDTGDVWTSLVTYSRENQVQTLPLGIPCSQWSCTVVSDRVGFSRSQHPRTRLSPLSWEARSGCFAFETGLIRAGVLRRCTKSVEQPARWSRTPSFSKRNWKLFCSILHIMVWRWNFV